MTEIRCPRCGCRTDIHPNEDPPALGDTIKCANCGNGYVKSDAYKVHPDAGKNFDVQGEISIGSMLAMIFAVIAIGAFVIGWVVILDNWDGTIPVRVVP